MRACTSLLSRSSRGRFARRGRRFKFGDANELGVIFDEGTRISFELAATCWNDALNEDFEEDFEEGKPGDTVVLYIGD